MLEQPILSELYKLAPQINAQWEIYFLRAKSHIIEGKDLKIDRKKTSFVNSFSIRVIKDSKAGFANCRSIEKIPEAFNIAIELSKHSKPDEFIHLPQPLEIKPLSVFDDNITKINGAISDFLISMQRSALFDKRIKKLRNAEINVSTYEIGIINSEGLAISNPFTSISAHIISIAEEENSQMSWAYRAERFLKNIDFEEIGKEASKKALMLLNPKKISPFKGWILLEPYVASEFLELICQSLSAENFQLGKSIFINKMNEIVMNEALDIIDNGVIPERFGSTPFDAEGVPTNKKTLIEKGVLKSLMHNSYTARRWGMKNSTGNAIRNERGISVGPTNLYIESNLPQSSFDDLLKFIDKGIYILEVMGMHTANPVSGDFSVGIAGVYIEKGELKYPVKEAIISGNVSQIFKNIKALGQDLTFYRNIGTPTLLVEGIDISG